MKKNQKTNQRHQAFSLIEISIVILIIGILLVGVTQSSRLVNQIKISSAQSITRSSEVSSISDIVFWAETTLDGALTNVNGSFQFEDGNSISSWNDINIRSNPKINVLQSNTSFQPTFKQNGINGLPSVSFNGTNQIFISTTIAPLPANDKNYSLVLVWRANSVSVAAGQMLMSQTGNPVNNNEGGSMFITASSTYGFAGIGNDAFPTSVSPNINYISIITVNNTLATNNISLYTNSNTATNSTSTNPSTLQLASARFSIGGRADSLQFFGGLISEAIVFDRTLRSDEVRAINNYLGKKYSIKIS
ncbi:MAG: LamG-like jellyroll fold domain-containing protein [Alphaproteobacteria bacterium]